MNHLSFALGITLLGWLAGAFLAMLIDQLGAGPDKHLAPYGRSFLAPDPLLQGFQALVWGALALHFGLSVQLAIYSALSVALTLTLFIDLRTRYVYGVVIYPGILAGVFLTPLAQGRPFWVAGMGALLGGAAFGLLYLVGRLLYRGNAPLAGGDVGIASLIGSVVGVGGIVPALMLGVVISGLVAVGVAIHSRSLRVYLPYGPGLCMGALIIVLGLL